MSRNDIPADAAGVLWGGRDDERPSPVECAAQLLAAVQRMLREWREQDAAENWSAFDEIKVADPPAGLVGLIETVDELTPRIKAEMAVFQRLCRPNSPDSLDAVPALSAIACDILGVGAAINALLVRFAKSIEQDCQVRERAARALIAGRARYNLSGNCIVAIPPVTNSAARDVG